MQVTFVVSYTVTVTTVGTTTQVSSQGREFWVAFLDNRVEVPVNQPLEIYVAAGHYATGVKATVQMWYYSPYGRREEVYDTTEINSDSVKILTVPAYMRNVGECVKSLLLLAFLLLFEYTVFG